MDAQSSLFLSLSLSFFHFLSLSLIFVYISLVALPVPYRTSLSKNKANRVFEIVGVLQYGGMVFQLQTTQRKF